MDLDYLFQRHQVSLVRASEARGVGARFAHRELARRYATLIEQDRASRPSDAVSPADLTVESHPLG